MLIAIPAFERMTALDAIGPYEVLHRLPDVEVVFVGHRAGPVRADSGTLGIVADATFTEVPHPEVVLFPGGDGTRPLTRDDDVLSWVRSAHATSTWTTSVCTGSLVLAAAGVLDGVDATTHWGAVDDLRALGANPVAERVVERGRIITAAGVSSGIDMGLTLAARLTDDVTAAAVQLMIEYDPEPPYDAGSVAKAGDEVVTRLVELLALERHR
jgi:putative intracellular protease/amidase